MTWSAGQNSYWGISSTVIQRMSLCSSFWGVPSGDRGVEQSQVDGEIGVGVGDLQKDAAHRHRTASSSALPDEGGLLGLNRLHLAAHKLPQQSPGLWAGRWQIINFSPDQIRAATTWS